MKAPPRRCTVSVAVELGVRKELESREGVNRLPKAAAVGIVEGVEIGEA